MGAYQNAFGNPHMNTNLSAPPAVQTGPPLGFGGEQDKRLGVVEKSLTTIQLQLNQNNNNVQ